MPFTIFKMEIGTKLEEVLLELQFQKMDHGLSTNLVIYIVMAHKPKNGNDIQVVQKILEQELMDLSLSSVAQRLKGGKVSINWDKQNGIKSQVVQPILQ